MVRKKIFLYMDLPNRIMSFRYAGFLILLLFLSFTINAEDGNDLWLRYSPVANDTHAVQVNKLFSEVVLPIGKSDTYRVLQEELDRAVRAMTGGKVMVTNEISGQSSLVIGTLEDHEALVQHKTRKKLEEEGGDAFLIVHSTKGSTPIVVIANTPLGALYGTFELLRRIQVDPSLEGILPLMSAPRITERILNHWDNLDRTVERGYSGFSIWDWHKLPEYISPRYIDYARANASIGINGTVLTSVNANSFVLTPQYIEKVKALADVFRPFGIKVYLTARFSSPIEIGGLETADPLDHGVQAWWNEKVAEIYRAIPDFGGFLVKANSEGQPGPQDYDRSHAEGANMLADALKPFGGIVMWRAFVYSHEVPDDRAKQANMEFEPLDGQFRENVFIQVKNGPIDFQPREPFHPLFGAMKQTKLALELQITQEYLGQATNLVYLGTLFKDCLESRTYRPGKGSTVASVVDGTDFKDPVSVIAGVSNIGTDRNWTGHLFGQSNWYAFGRLAWDHNLGADEIAEEWISLTFGNDPEMRSSLSEMMMDSWETFISYSTPLGLHHIMGWDHHYGPGPWVEGGRPDWTSLYYHRADEHGIGFDRTAEGSNALSQYAAEIRKEWENLETCPEQYLLWFHHVPWDHTMKSGMTLWEAMCREYDSGVKGVREMTAEWSAHEEKIDTERFEHVTMLLKIQEKEAEWWRNSCLLYFQTFSGMDFPSDIEQPEGTLEHYKNLRFPYAPGIRPKW